MPPVLNDCMSGSEVELDHDVVGLDRDKRHHVVDMDAIDATPERSFSNCPHFSNGASLRSALDPRELLQSSTSSFRWTPRWDWTRVSSRRRLHGWNRVHSRSLWIGTHPVDTELSLALAIGRVCPDPGEDFWIYIWTWICKYINIWISEYMIHDDTRYLDIWNYEYRFISDNISIWISLHMPISVNISEYANICETLWISVSIT